EVLDRDLARIGHDLRAARVAVVLFDLAQLPRDDLQDQRLRGQDLAETRDRRENLLILLHELLALESRQALQAHLEDGLCLNLAERPARDEAVLRLLRRSRRADERDQLVEDIERPDEAFEHMRALLGLAQVEARAAD